MLNPKAIRVKSQLANSKKGKSSTGGFPETDFAGDVNKVLGIDKLVESKPEQPKKVASSQKPALKYTDPLNDYVPIGEAEESYITPEQQAENKVLSDIEVYKKRNLQNGIVIEYTPEQIKNKVKIQLQSDSDDRAYESRAKAIALTTDEEEEIDSEYKSIKEQSFAMPGESLTPIMALRQRAKQELIDSGVKNINDNTIDTYVEKIFKEEKEADIAKAKSNELLRNSTPDFQESIKRSIRRQQDELGLKENKNVELLVAAETKRKESKTYIDKLYEIRKNYFDGDTQVKAMDQQTASDYNRLIKKAKDASNAGAIIAKGIDTSVEEKANKLAREYDLLDREYGRLSERSYDFAIMGGNVLKNIYGIGGWAARAANSVYESVAGDDGKVSTPQNSSLLKAVEYFDNKAADVSMELKGLQEETAEKTKGIYGVNGFIDHSANMLIDQWSTITTLGAGGKLGLTAVGALATGGKYAEMTDETNGSGYIETAINKGVDKANELPEKYSDSQYVFAPLLHGMLEAGSEYVTQGILKKASNVFKIAEAESGIVRKTAMDKFKSTIKENGIDLFKEEAGELITNIGQNAVDKYLLGKEDVNLLDNSAEVIRDTALMTVLFQSAPHIAVAAAKPFFKENSYAKIQDNSYKILELTKRLETENLTKSESSAINSKVESLRADNKNSIKSAFKVAADMPQENFTALLDYENEMAKIKKEATEIYYSDKSDKGSLIKELEEKYKSVNKERNNTLRAADQAFNTLAYGLSTSDKQSVFNLLLQKQKAEGANIDPDSINYKINKEQIRLIENKVKDIVLSKGFDKEFVDGKFISEGGDIDVERLNKSMSNLGFTSEVIVLDDADSVADFAAKNNIATTPESLNANGQFLVDDKTKKEYLILNKKHIVKNGLFNTGQHEFLHKVINKAISNDPNLAIHLGKSLWQEIDRYLGGKAQDTELAARLQIYQNSYESGNYDFAKYIEEVLPLFSEALSDGTIEYSTAKTFLNAVRNIVYKVFGFLNMDIEPSLLKLDTGADIASFVKEYNKGYAKGEFSKAIQALAKDGKFKTIKPGKMNISEDNMFYRVEQPPLTVKQRADMKRAGRLNSRLSLGYKDQSLSIDERMDALDKALDNDDIDFDSYEAEMKKLEYEEANGSPMEEPVAKAISQVKKASENKIVISEEDKLKNVIRDNKASVASEKVQAIYDAKGIDGAFDIIKLFRPITMKIVNKRKDAPGFDEELLRDEIETGDGGLMALIKTYKPSSGTPLAAYINKNLPLRAIAASKRILDQEFFKDSSEEKGLMATETADQTMTARVAEKPKYADSIEANVLEPEAFESIKKKVLSTVRTLKSKVDEKVSINRTVTPIISEIISELGTQADIDIKTALGGKADGVLRKSLLTNKRYILENMTTTWLMGKDNGTSVAGGIPQAIQKKVGGKWLSYPDWIGKKADRESVSTYLAGRTSGAELVRRLPNAFNNITNEDFLDQFLDPNGNPIRGRKESLSKVMAEEIALDLIKADFAEEGEIYDAFVANQTRLGVDTSIALISEFNKQSERGNVKYSLDIDMFKSIFNNSNDIAASLIENNFSPKSVIDAIKKYTKIAIDESDAKAISRGLIRASFEKNKDISSRTKGILSVSNINLLADPNLDLRLSNSDVISVINRESSGKVKLDTLRNQDGSTSPLGKLFIARLMDDVEKANYSDDAVKDFIDITNAVFRFSYTASKGGKYISNSKYMDMFFGKDTKLGKNAKSWSSTTVKDKDGKAISHITLNGKIYKPYSFDVTLINKKKAALSEISNINDQSKRHRKLFYDTLNKLKAAGETEIGLAFISDQAKHLKSNLSLLANFYGYESGVFEKDNIVWEHRPTRNEIVSKSVEFMADKNDSEDFNNFLSSAKVFAVSTDFNDALNKFARKSDTINRDAYSTVSRELNTEIVGINGLPINNYNNTTRYSLSDDFNKILEDTRGVKAKEQFSDITARVIGSGKGKYRFFVPPSAEDFAGLLYDFMGKGKAGEAHAKFFQDNLIHPYVKGVERMDNVRANIKEGYKALKAEYPAESKKLKTNVEGKDFTYDQAVRVYLWQTNGTDVPGLSAKEITAMSNTVKKDKKLREFSDKLSIASGQLNGWVEPTAYWNVESIVSDLHNATEKIGRRNILKDFISNSDEIFSAENLNKIEATLGTNYREALEDSLFRMKNGTNRSSGDKFSSAWMNWVANANGVIMFFNTRSAILQTIAATNYINWSDNNVLAAGKAFLNQPQYWKDFSMIFNSNKMKERREGLKADVNEAELANAVRGSKNKAKAALSYLLKIGYTPTQMADSFAIASGGATFYRNRVNTYLKQGMPQADAESKAFEDFDNATEESQQSSDPSKLSQQQASTVGRLVLAFANTPMQYNRLMKKAFRDLINGRGDVKTHVSKILYYGAVQNIVFSALQNAMFASLFDDDDEEKDAKAKADKENKKVNDLLNGMADTILRGAGFYGAIASTAKNVVLRYIEEDEKGIKGDQTKTLVAAVGISPPLGSKAQKLYSAMQTKKFDADVIAKRGFGLTADGKLNPSPSYDVAGKLIAVATNFPADRVVDKVNNVAEALDARNKTWQRIALGLGWNSYSVGVVNEEDDLIKAEAKAVRKKEGTEKAKATRKLKSIAKQEAENRKLDSIANLSDEELIKYYENEELAKIEKKNKELDSIANLPDDKLVEYYQDKERKKELAKLKRKIKKSFR
jgi:hypothetical protein